MFIYTMKKHQHTFPGSVIGFRFTCLQLCQGFTFLRTARSVSLALRFTIIAVFHSVAVCHLVWAASHSHACVWLHDPASALGSINILLSASICSLSSTYLQHISDTSPALTLQYHLYTYTTQRIRYVCYGLIQRFLIHQ